MLDLLKIVVEIIGTFFFLSVILQTLTDNSITPISIVITLLGAIYFGASTSGAHFNPAVSFAMFLKNKMELNLFIAYVLAQLIGSSLAVKFNEFIVKKSF